MNARVHLLVIDAYDAAGRNSLVAKGVTPAGRLYARVIAAVDPTASAEVVQFGEPGESLSRDLERYDGIVWTGSNLTVHKPDAAVDTQLAMARSAFEAGVPQFGSCWAIQLAAVAAGGACARNPRGREFGIGRGITRTEAGHDHPLLRGRPDIFAGFVSHEDMVVALPAGATRLAGNDFCDVQALEVRQGRGVFWAVQYHPEYDFYEVARLAALRSEQLVREAHFIDFEQAEAFVAAFEALHRAPEEEDLLRRHQVPPEVIDPERRRTELRNWLASLVRRRPLA
jgi:GMP synthase (glutamine-hydrolysing)